LFVIVILKESFNRRTAEESVLQRVWIRILRYAQNDIELLLNNLEIICWVTAGRWT